MAMSLSVPGEFSVKRREPSSSSGFWFAFFLMTIMSIAAGSFLSAHLVKTLRSQGGHEVVQGGGGAPQGDAYSANHRIREMRPLVTNLEAPRDAWVRVSGVLVLGDQEIEDVDLLVAHVEEDLLAYMRSVSLLQIEGAVGLQHLREDLNERAKARSDGAVSEVILQSLVIQ